MKLVLATQNPKKLKEMNEILSHLGVEVVNEAELGVRIEVEETGETFTDNARLKATAVMQATGLPAVADDSGLCVDALNGGPGVYSARFGGGWSWSLKSCKRGAMRSLTAFSTRASARRTTSGSKPAVRMK